MKEIEPGLVALLIIVPLGLSMIAHCLVAFKYTERFESLLNNCTFIMGNKKTFQGAGLPGKIMRTGLITWVLAMPHLFNCRGLIDLEEVQRFPRVIRRWLVTLLCIQTFFFAALIISHYLQPSGVA